MQSKIQIWSRKFWGFVLGLGALIALLVGLFDLQERFRELRATPTPPPTIVPTSTLRSTNTPIPTVSSTPTPGPFQFVDLPKQVKAGDDVRVTVLAWQGTSCHLDFFTPDGNPSQAKGLGSATPDSRSQCTWEWHIRADTSLGVGKLIVEINDLKETFDLEILPK